MIEYKGYNIKSDGKYGNVHIHQKTAGKIPSSLTGAFTSPSVAKSHIDRYLSLKGFHDAGKGKRATQSTR